MTLKETIQLLHLWPGLASGIVVFIISITGCLYAFQEEIQNATQPFRYVDARQTAFLPLSKLQAIATAQLPGKHLHVVMYSGQKRRLKPFSFTATSAVQPSIPRKTAINYPLRARKGLDNWVRYPTLPINKTQLI